MYIFSSKLIILCLLFKNIKMQDNDKNESDEEYDEISSTELTVKSCKEKNLLIGLPKEELYYIVEATLNERIILDCHYCNEIDEHEAKIWYKIEHLNKTPHEVELDMHKNENMNRVSVSVDHSLIIHNLTSTDAGTYYCQGLQKDKLKDVFDFIVDISQNKSDISEKGNLSVWKTYHDDYMLPINKVILTSDEQEFSNLRHNLQTQLEVITDWEMNFGPCEVCGRPQGEGIQEKSGFCRIKIEKIHNKTVNHTIKSSQKMQYFLNLPKVSCRSFLLEELFPKLFNMTKHLKDFILVGRCDGVCNPDALGINQGWKFSSSKKFKYRRTITMMEGEHLTLVCPEATLDNEIIWRRNGKVLPQGEPVITNEKDLDSIHIIVDVFSSLSLIHVTEAESGNYTCQVNNIRMQQIRVYVVSKSRLLSEAFLRHMMYLMFILLMSCTCYCAGIVATFKRRHIFKKYEQIPTTEPLSYV